MGALLVATMVILRNAWASDDAYITMRTVDHFCHGRGLTWNPGERVQAYTHPLWMLLLSAIYCVVEDAYATLIGLGVLTSVAALIVLARCHARNFAMAGAMILVLVSTRSFVDYSTSGLENPLTHLLLGIYLWVFWEHQSRRQLLILTLLTSMLVLDRVDAVLIILPATVTVTVRHLVRERSVLGVLGVLLIGFSPVFLWEVFSLFYYGSLIPNTALAKLNTGIPRLELVEQGFLYLLDSIQRDPLTLLVIGMSGTALMMPGQTCAWPICLGIGLHLVYVVMIGGDFMSGRFLSVPLFASALLLVRSLPTLPSSTTVLAVGGLALGLCCDRPTFGFDGSELPSKANTRGKDGIADEQAFWYPESGLLTASRGRSLPVSKHRTEGEKGQPDQADEVGAAGYRGFYSPPDVYLLDHNALVDPLLSRLPARKDRWRPGHFRRRIPKGYTKTLIGETNRLKDPEVRELYQDVRLVTRGELLQPGRLSAIWRLATGQSAAGIRQDYL